MSWITHCIFLPKFKNRMYVPNEFVFIGNYVSFSGHEGEISSLTEAGLVFLGGKRIAPVQYPRKVALW